MHGYTIRETEALMELIFIRHGKPKVEPGDNDPVLTDAARMQAEHVGHWLRRENIARVISSPMRRALETAEPTSRILGLKLEIRDGLAEVGRFGPGYRGIEALRKDPVGWAKFMDDPISFLGGDPVSFKRGVLDAVGGLFDDRPERKTAVFAHGLPINVVLSHALGLKRVSHFLPHYCSLTRVSGPSLDDINIESINETAHLANSEQTPAARLEAGAPR
jgi:broad specificity phosphatase PhoE